MADLFHIPCQPHGGLMCQYWQSRVLDSAVFIEFISEKSRGDISLSVSSQVWVLFLVFGGEICKFYDKWSLFHYLPQSLPLLVISFNSLNAFGQLGECLLSIKGRQKTNVYYYHPSIVSLVCSLAEYFLFSLGQQQPRATEASSHVARYFLFLGRVFLFGS